jgi:hypothetical protein
VIGDLVGTDTITAQGHSPWARHAGSGDFYLATNGDLHRFMATDNACPNGHPLRPANVAVAHLPCRCNGAGGHRMYTCRTCDVSIYDPPHVKGAATMGG